MEVNEINPHWLLREIALLNSKVHDPIRQMHLDGLKKDILEIVEAKLSGTSIHDDRFTGVHARLNAFVESSNWMKETIRYLQTANIENYQALDARVLELELLINKPRKVKKMAKLTTATRKKIPSKKFAEPKERKFPIEDKAHAANAKARATQGVKKGTLSAAEAAKIKTKANKVLKKKAK